MQELLLTPSTGNEPPNKYEPISIWNDESPVPVRAMVPRIATKALIALLDAAKGHRLVGIHSRELGALAAGDDDRSPDARMREAERGLEYLARVKFIQQLEITGLRKIRLITALDSFEMKKLYDRYQVVLRALYAIADGRKTFVVKNSDISERTGFSGAQVTKILLMLRRNKAIEELMPGTGPVTIYRIDVKRRSGRGVQLQMLSPDLGDDVEPYPLVGPRPPQPKRRGLETTSVVSS